MNRIEVKNWHFALPEEASSLFGETITTPDYSMQGWHPITVPGTVVNGFAENKLYPDPYEGMEMAKLPGFKSESKHIFSQFPKPHDSPFRKPFWYRTQLDIKPPKAGHHLFLRLSGISYAANAWLNGKRIAGSDYLRGTFRNFDLDITKLIKADAANILALEIFSPEPDDLGLTFIDWSVVPPDDCMGLTQPAFLYETGPVAMRNLFVKSSFSGKTLAPAHLSVYAEVENLEGTEQEALVNAEIEGIRLSQKIKLAPWEKKEIVFSPKKFSKLIIKNPRLWWPHQLGKPELYSLKMNCQVAKNVSDKGSINFGIRTITSRLNKHGARVFAVNGKEILIRGAGWAPDMLQRQSNDRDLADVTYIKNCNLNLVRFEGMMGSEYFMDECDRQGILVMAGWACCNHWEKWEDWKPGDLTVAAESMRSQIVRLRHRASLAMFLYGSDKAPPEPVEKAFVDILKQYYPELTRLSSAAVTPTKYGGDTGVKMTGPYAYVPPILWYKQEMRGAANLFNTETGPGMSIPPYESLLKMLPESERRLASDTWNFHCGISCFPNTLIDDRLIEQRFGTPRDLQDYAKCAQVAGYEAWRAMYEAHLRNFPLATGVVAWMLNSAWPSMIWQLYDYYLNPLGGFFGTQKACEPLHALYSYDDHSIWVCNSSLKEEKKITVTATVYNLDLTKKLERSQEVTLNSLQSLKAFDIADLKETSSVYFLRIDLSRGKKRITDNFYFLSSVPEVFADQGIWYHFPLKKPSDMSALRSLPEAKLDVKTTLTKRGAYTRAQVSITNISGALAFFLRAKIYDENRKDYALPVYWDENCISLLPGETRIIHAEFTTQNQEGCRVEIDGWNCGA